jgi:hypothetical protein
LLRFGLAASASCGNPPTRYRVFSASVECLAIASRCLEEISSVAGGRVVQLPLACCFQTPNGMMIAEQIDLLIAFSMPILQLKVDELAH